MKLANSLLRVFFAGVSGYFIYDVITREEKPLSADIPTTMDGRIKKPEEVFLALVFGWLALTNYWES
jgi:hypothetical protein